LKEAQQGLVWVTPTSWGYIGKVEMVGTGLFDNSQSIEYAVYDLYKKSRQRNEGLIF